MEAQREASCQQSGIIDMVRSSSRQRSLLDAQVCKEVISTWVAWANLGALIEASRVLAFDSKPRNQSRAGVLRTSTMVL